jgi:uncharacterized protein
VKAKIRNILNELQTALKPIYKDRLVKLILFGSQARMDAESGSDIDVMVILKGRVNPGEEIRRIGRITSALSLKHDAVISCTFISEDRFDTEKSPLLMNARREGVGS